MELGIPQDWAIKVISLGVNKTPKEDQPTNDRYVYTLANGHQVRLLRNVGISPGGTHSGRGRPPINHVVKERYDPGAHSGNLPIRLPQQLPYITENDARVLFAVACGAPTEVQDNEEPFTAIFEFPPLNDAAKTNLINLIRDAMTGEGLTYEELLRTLGEQESSEGFAVMLEGNEAGGSLETQEGYKDSH